MVGNPHKWRAVIPQLENRNSTAGCLLALIFFVPLLSKTFHISVSVVLLFTAIYVSILVPIGTGIISKKYVLGRIRKFACLIFDEQQWNYYLLQFSYISDWIHYIYFQVNGVQILTMQVVFNIAAEKLFCPLQTFSYLYVLLFYSLLAYIQRSLKERPWAQLFNENTTTEFIKLTTAFVIVRLGKGIAVTMVLMTFSYHFNNIEPTYTFLCMTFFYFFFTQYQNSDFFKSNLVEYLTKLELQCLDGLEEHWVPVLLYSCTIAMSTSLFFGLLLCTNNYIAIICLGCINIWIPVKYLLQSSWETLSTQKAIISKFTLAKWNNPQIRAGYPCAVCLDRLRILSARTTPCGHVFHGSCLRKCLQHSKQCPLCKTLL